MRQYKFSLYHAQCTASRNLIGLRQFSTSSRNTSSFKRVHVSVPTENIITSTSSSFQSPHHHILSNPLASLHSRGMLQATTTGAYESFIIQDDSANDKDDQLLVRYHHQKQETVYCGFDPTAISLHLGNLLPFMSALWFAVNGHRFIAVVREVEESVKRVSTLEEILTCPF